MQLSLDRSVVATEDKDRKTMKHTNLLTTYSVEQMEIRTFGTSGETINDFQHGLIHFSINWSDDISYKHVCSEV